MEKTAQENTKLRPIEVVGAAIGITYIAHKLYRLIRKDDREVIARKVSETARETIITGVETSAKIIKPHLIRFLRRKVEDLFRSESSEPAQ
jgi:hypothetical protein